jgi:hypothetical protein
MMKDWKTWALLAAVAAIVFLLLKAQQKKNQDAEMQPGEEVELTEQNGIATMPNVTSKNPPADQFAR